MNVGGLRANGLMKDRVFMSDTGLEQQEPGVTTGRDPTENEPGELRTMETTTPDTAVASVPSAAPLPMQPKPQRRQDQAATIEHLAARRAVPPLSADAPEVKYRLSILRTDITRLVTGLRWGGVPIEDTTEQLIPLLDVGPLQQWAPVLVPYLLEIDRAGNSKSQDPNPKEAPIRKLLRGRAPRRLELGAWDFSGAWCLVFGVWDLELLWNLEIGIWSFVPVSDDTRQCS